MQNAYTVRVPVIIDGHILIIFCSQANIVSIMANTLWRLHYVLKEATTGCVIGICSKVISKFTYWLPLQQPPSERFSAYKVSVRPE